MKTMYRETVIALADNGMSISKAARVLYIAPQTVTWRCVQIEKATGLNPRDFHGLCKLYEDAIKEERFLKWN